MSSLSSSPSGEHSHSPSGEFHRQFIFNSSSPSLTFLGLSLLEFHPSPPQSSQVAPSFLGGGCHLFELASTTVGSLGHQLW